MGEKELFAHSIGAVFYVLWTEVVNSGMMIFFSIGSFEFNEDKCFLKRNMELHM